ncbi:MAG: hypothetical protein OK442_06895 [Thaumarchaeota archaeon]|nr:hypothetical protein [Nitrososphaerota archaeon]
MPSRRRALVTLPEGIWEVIDKELKGKIGDGDSEVIRAVVTAYLTEKGYLLKPQPAAPQNTVVIEQIAGEIDMHDNMITALAEMLEESGNLKYDEWERRVKKKVSKR